MTTTMRFLAALLALVVVTMPSKADDSKTYTWRQALDAIRQVETGGEPNEGIGAIGDGGGAAGPYQIHRAYHTDAKERDKSLSLYSKCLVSKEYSERVMAAYMGRYARAERDRLQAGKGTLADLEKIARIHNGGPRGHQKRATWGYWRKVLREVTR